MKNRNIKALPIENHGDTDAIFVDERIELDPDWIIITLNKCAPDPDCRSGA
jgi:hypothetical protein